MFHNAKSFNQPLNGWIVSKVLNLEGMFERAEAFNQPFNEWKVSNVTNMRSMFERTKAFNQLIDSWDISKVTTMEGILSSCCIENKNKFIKITNNIKSSINLILNKMIIFYIYIFCVLIFYMTK